MNTFIVTVLFVTAAFLFGFMCGDYVRSLCAALRALIMCGTFVYVRRGGRAVKMRRGHAAKMSSVKMSALSVRLQAFVFEEKTS